jgi:hypothetical protein
MLREVTREEFYEAVGPHDLVTRLEGNWPYTVLFEFRNRVGFGRITAELDGGFPPARSYFLEVQP